MNNQDNAENKTKNKTKTKREGKPSALFIIKAVIGVLIAGVLIAGIIIFDNAYVCYGGETYRSDLRTLSLRGSEELDVDALTKFEAMRSLDLRDTDLNPLNYDRLHDALPDCEILWSIPIAGKVYDSNSVIIDISEATEKDFELLKYFTALRTVNAGKCELYDELLRCREEMPDCKFTWQVELCGALYNDDERTLVLKAPDIHDLKKLDYMQQLESVTVTDCTLYDRLIELQTERPECDFVWSYKLFGYEVSSSEQVVNLSGKKITDTSTLKDSLRYLPNMKKLILADCGVTYKDLDKLNKQFPELEIVWRVYFGKWSLLTDATVFSTLNPDPPGYRLVDDEVSVLKYCTKLQLLDLGHQAISSVEPFVNMTELRVLILADNRIKDISSLSKLTKLEYLEMFINRVGDISVLEKMPNLTHVNFSWNGIDDLTPLLKLKKLKMAWLSGNWTSAETQKSLRTTLPDCEFEFYTRWGSTNGNWRYNDTYYKLYDAFHKYNGKCTYNW